MKRRKFILASVLSAPAFAIGQTDQPKTKGLKKGFTIKANQNRFHEKTKLFGSNPVDIKVSINDTDGRLSISEYTGYTKGGPPLHVHPFQDEVFIILEGEHLFQVGEEQFHLTAGDTIFLPRNVPHAPCQLSEKGRYLFFFTPSGKMEDFMRALAELKVTGQPSPEMMAKLFEAHDMKIVGPPLQF
jgi:quercetin dioxygenase-like cupin family protein